MSSEALALVRRQLRDQLRLAGGRARARLGAAHRAPRAGARGGAGAAARQRRDPSAARTHAHGQRSLGRGRRVRSHRVPAEGPGRDRGHGQRTRRRVRGARGADREGAGWAIRGGGVRPASDRTHRGTLGPPGRRIIALGGCATSGRFAGPRDHPAPLAPRSRAHHPQVLAGADPGRATSWPAAALGPRMLQFLSSRRSAGARTSSSAAAPGAARPRCSACCQRVHPRRRAARSPSRTPPSSGSPSRTSSRWKPGRPTSRAGAR